MDRPRLIRGLRIAVSAVCGLACLSVALMWYRSIRYQDVIDGGSTSGEFVFILSANGGVAFTGSPNLWALVQAANWSNLEDKLNIKMDEFYNIAKVMGQLQQLDMHGWTRSKQKLEQLQNTAKELANSRDCNLNAKPTNPVFHNFSYDHSGNRTVLVIAYWFRSFSVLL